MTRLMTIIVALVALVASAAAQPARESKKKGKTHRFKDNRSGKPGLKRGVNPSKIKPTRTEAALKFTVVDKNKGPIPGIVISLTSPKNKTYYTDETDAQGYTEVLVPVGRKYDLVYLSLGRRKISVRVPVSKEPRQTIRLTLRYKRWVKPPQFVLNGVEFDTGKATIRPESFPRLNLVVVYMKHKQSARIEIAGHTDNVGNRRRNKALSKLRAKACRKYLRSKGIAGGPIRAVGYGDERPIASNATEEGRQQNRRITARELIRP